MKPQNSNSPSAAPARSKGPVVSIVLLAAALALVVLLTRITRTPPANPSAAPSSPSEPAASQTSGQGVAAENEIRLELRGTPPQARVGEEIVVEVIMTASAAGTAVEGADIVLAYDSAKLAFMDNSIKAGEKLTQLIASPAPTENLLRFSLLPSSPQMPPLSSAGSETIARLSFRAKTAGTASLSLVHEQGNTADTNIASAGGDILTSAAPLTLSITD